MGEAEQVLIEQLFFDGDRANEPVEGVFRICDKSHVPLKMLTKNLEPGQEFHENENFYHADGSEFRVINPIESMLGLALVEGIRNIFVKPGLKVLYIARDDSAAVTISHLSDLVGVDGVVFVASEHRAAGGRFDRLLNQRANVIYLGTTATNPSQCSDNLHSMFKGPIDVLYCDVGHPNQVQYLYDHASKMLKNGGHFVAFIKANKMVYTHNHVVVVPNDCIFESEMMKMKELGFKRVEAKSFGRIARDWSCVVGLFNARSYDGPRSFES